MDSSETSSPDPSPIHRPEPADPGAAPAEPVGRDEGSRIQTASAQSRTRPPSDPIIPWAGAFGGLLLAGAMLSALGYALTLATSAVGGSPPELVAVPGSLAVLLALLGGGLVVGALGLHRGQGSRRFAPASAAAWLSLALVVLILGTGVLLLNQPIITSLLLPPLHAAATLLPTLAVVGFVIGAAKRPAWATWRGTLARLSWGACIATSLALVAQIILMIVVGSVAFALLSLSESGQAAIEALLGMATQAQTQTDPESFDPTSLLPALHPVVLVAGFSILAFLAPLAEEVTKLLGVVVRRPASRAQAWVWGCTVGAGFGLLEGVFYAALQVTPVAWPLGIAARSLTLIVHATMTGVAALGYFAVRQGDRRGWLGMAAAVIGHGLWNGMALATVLFGLLAGAGQDASASAGGAPALVTVSVLIVLFYIIFFTFISRSRRLGREEAEMRAPKQASDETATIAS